MNELTGLTIAGLAQQIQRRRVSCLEATEAALEQIENTEPIVRAFATYDPDTARRAARRADREIQRGASRGLLHGVPVAVKDVCFTRGVTTEAGSRVMAGFVPSYDATVVTRLRRSGAIIIGKTSTQEFAIGMSDTATVNPWASGYWPGGSSVGSAVAVAVGSAFGSIGTDTGGSIRTPASINGVVGLKPTFGLVSCHGIIPVSPSLDHVGPIARTVEDAAILLGAIAGSDLMDRTTSLHPTKDYLRGLGRGLKSARIGIERGYFLSDRVADDVKIAFDRALSALTTMGAQLVDVSIHELVPARSCCVTIMTVEAAALHERRLRQTPDAYDPRTRSFLEAGQRIPASLYISAQRARIVIRDAVKRVFRSHRLQALVAPTLPSASIHLDHLSTDLAADTSDRASFSSIAHHTNPANVTGQPAVTVPCALTAAGLPIGLQLIGRPFDEANLLRIAHAYDASRPHYRPSISTHEPRADEDHRTSMSSPFT
jgi:aspartyl-tRNA(Asn)/glutamyl-tRNA(Gln) amidotransferase subunit A